jgi:hypothetical protein
MPVVGCFGISASCRTTARMALVPALQREIRALTASASTSTVATGDGGSAAGENTYNMSLDAPPSPLSSGQARPPLRTRSGDRAMFTAIRRASSAMSTFACLVFSTFVLIDRLPPFLGDLHPQNEGLTPASASVLQHRFGGAIEHQMAKHLVRESMRHQ